MTKKSLLAGLIFLVYLGFSQNSVSAEEISVSVSGNGESSNNTIDQTVSQTTFVTQTNNSNVSNNIDQNLNTGQNSTSQNTSNEAALQTGNISSQTEILNNTNNNAVDSTNCGCDPSSLTINNSSNGTGSQNIINSSIDNLTQISVSNWAEIDNNVLINANSGKNHTDNNSGSVQIITGDINVKGKIKNIGNNSLVEIDPSDNDVLISNVFNGSYSTNLLNVDIDNLINVSQYNFSNANNNVDIIVDTGNNTADGNIGDAFISTGDVYIDFSIDNNFNNNIAKISNCLPIGGQTDPGDPGQQPGTTSSSSVSSSSSAAAGQVLAAIAALPSTGPASFIFLVLFWLTLTGIGLFLRRASGLSPPNLAILG